MIPQLLAPCTAGEMKQMMSQGPARLHAEQEVQFGGAGDVDVVEERAVAMLLCMSATPSHLATEAACCAGGA